MLRSSFTNVRESLPGERMKLQEKLERMTMTAFERRLLKQWLAANEETDEKPLTDEPASDGDPDPAPCTGPEAA